MIEDFQVVKAERAARTPFGEGDRDRARSLHGEPGPLTVYVVDDDGMVRDAVRALLETYGHPVEAFASGEAFLDAHRSGRDGCLLVDAKMPGMGGLDLLDRLKADGRALPTIVFTGDGSVQMAVRAMKAGAAHFIEKPVHPDELLASIGQVFERLREGKAEADAPTPARPSSGKLGHLTARQRQIMDMVLEGQRSKTIAARLGISQRTVENHRAAVMKKTGAKSLAALIKLALADTPGNHRAP